jgi:hypothetical protein
MPHQKSFLMSGDENPVQTKNQTQDVENRASTPRQSPVSHRDSIGVVGDDDSVKGHGHEKKPVQTSQENPIFLPMDAEKFIKFLKDLDPNKYLPLPLNIQ